MGKDHTKYYNYIIEDVDEKTIFHTTTNVYGVTDTWFSFNFGEERYHTIQYNGGQGICNMFKLYNPGDKSDQTLENPASLKAPSGPIHSKE